MTTMDQNLSHSHHNLRHNGHHRTDQANDTMNSTLAQLLLSPIPTAVSPSPESTPDPYLDLGSSPGANDTFLFNLTTIAPPLNTTAIPNYSHFVKSLYQVIVPVMIFLCIFTFIVNIVIVVSARWCRKPMSPTLYYSISLALADAYASFGLGLGLTVNSLLPSLYALKITRCFTLTLEVFRQGGVLVTVCHLLALGINHWIGIARPLHYAATMTRRTAWIVILVSWSCPIIMLFIYYSSIPGKGFQSEGCEDSPFIKRKTYRIFFATCFFVPLFLLCLIYVHIFLIVRSHQSNRLRYQSCQALRKNVKAAFTTVLILGTYVVGWMPAVIFSVTVCEDCIVQPKNVDERIRYSIGITVNLLIILKAFVDPIIYAARMSDIQLSLRKMKYDFLQLFCKCCVQSLPPPVTERGYFGSTTRTFSKFNRSLYDSNSKSIKRSSFGSSSSSRRGGASSSLIINNSPAGSQSHQHNHLGGDISPSPRNAARFNNSFLKHSNPAVNGSCSSSPNSHKARLLAQKKTTFEMTEMR